MKFVVRSNVFFSRYRNQFDINVSRHIRSVLNVLIFISGYCFKAQDYEEELISKPLPRIISQGETIRAAYGERVQLPCHVQQIGE